MKKLLSVLLTLMLVAGILSGCGKQAEGPSLPAKDPVSSPSADVPVETPSASVEPEVTPEPSVEPEPTEPYIEEELLFYRDGLKIYGKLYRPTGADTYPLVIMAHGLGGNHNQGITMAKRFALEGVAAYTFDFIGGGKNIQSDGATTDMSVLTQGADLLAVLDGFLAMPEVEKENIFLYGASQGGYVVSYAAAMRPDDIKALISLFPAYSLQETAETFLSNPEGLADEIDFLSLVVGRCYFEDAASVDIYELLPYYKNDVLLLHGTADTLIPIEYSQRAAQVFPSVEYIEVEGGTHGNLGEDANLKAIEFILEHID